MLAERRSPEPQPADAHGKLACRPPVQSYTKTMKSSSRLGCGRLRNVGLRWRRTGAATSAAVGQPRGRRQHGSPCIAAPIAPDTALTVTASPSTRSHDGRSERSAGHILAAACCFTMRFASSSAAVASSTCHRVAWRLARPGRLLVRGGPHGIAAAFGNAARASFAGLAEYRHDDTKGTCTDGAHAAQERGTTERWEDGNVGLGGC